MSDVKKELEWHVEQGATKIDLEGDSFFKDSLFYEERGDEGAEPLFQVREDDSVLGVMPLVVVSILVTGILAFAFLSGLLGLADFIFIVGTGTFMFLINFSITTHAENVHLRRQNEHLKKLVDKYHSSEH